MDFIPDINMQRTLVDQFMSRVINGFASDNQHSEDNYLTTADAVEEAHTVLASDLINEQLLYWRAAGKQMAWDMLLKWIPCWKTVLYELAQAR